MAHEHSSRAHVLAFYSRHPISREQILARLAAARGNLDALLPEDLFPHDQDHYGGLEVVDALAARAGIGRDMQVADFCAGLGGRRAIWPTDTGRSSPASN